MAGYVVYDMEKADHLIEALPFRYFRVVYKGMGSDGKDLILMCRLTRETVLGSDGQPAVKWVAGDGEHEKGRLWVTKELAEDLCNVGSQDKKMGVTPMAKLVKVGRDDEPGEAGKVEIEFDKADKADKADPAPRKRRAAVE